MPHYRRERNKDPEKGMRQESVKLKLRFGFNEMHKNDKVSALLT